MFKERMTPDELARLTGYSRQTINKWVRKEGWTTSPKPGVQGGKARLVHVNEQVREYIRNAERPEGQGEAPALSGDAPLEVLLVTLAKEMTPVEQKQFTSLLLREGIIGLLQRKTEKFPGVKGGRARLILVDTQVCEFIQNTPAFHNTPMLMEAEERIAEYAPGARAPAYRQIINAIDNMTDIEQEKVAQFLSREGIRNFLARLDIDESA